MIATFLAREFARQVVPSARQHREAAIARLKLSNLPKDQQDVRLNEDNAYVEGLIRRATTYLFPEFLGYALFKAFGASVHEVGRKLVRNGTMGRLFEDGDFKTIKEEMQSDQFLVAPNDIMQVLWSLFCECFYELTMGSGKQQWMMAPNRTRFNHGITTRELLMRTLDQKNDYISQIELTRPWAVGLNRAKGVYSYLRNELA